mgnify:FL=1
MSQITTDELQAYTGIVQEDTTLQQIYIDASENVVEDYLNKALADFDTIPGIIKLTVLRIAALMQVEADGNIGITSKTFGESGSRTFIKTTDYTPYLQYISKYREV